MVLGPLVGRRLLHDLRAVMSEIRPDWDLSTPDSGEAWNAGDLSRFHGWNMMENIAATSARWQNLA